jgi:hypothetical protein
VHCCSGKAVGITQSQWAFVALDIQHAVRMRHIVICGLPRSKIFFFHVISQTARFSKENVAERKMCDLIFSTISASNNFFILRRTE